jgi:hypothetical protein
LPGSLRPETRALGLELAGEPPVQLAAAVPDERKAIVPVSENSDRQNAGCDVMLTPFLAGPATVQPDVSRSMASRELSLVHHSISLTTIIVHILLTTIGGALAITLGEHAIHRHAMHRKRFPSWVYRLNPDMSAQFHNHAVLHHGTYYREFDHEPSADGKYFNLRILPADTLRIVVLFSPLLIALWLWVSLYSALTLLFLLVAHSAVWGAVHVQMHVPESNRFFRDTSYFRFIARHHFMHHQRMGKNYNVVIPLADFVLGSVTKPGVADVREMLRLGFLRPRTALGQRRLDRYRQKHLAARAAAVASV